MASGDEQEGEKRTNRRAAARRAGDLAAKQLESSPVRSGDDFGRPSFGGPSRRKAHVKVTYLKKARSPAKSSPIRSSAGESSKTPQTRLSLNTGSKPKPRPRPHPRVQAGGKKSATSGTTIAPLDDHASLSTLTDSENDDVLVSAAEPARRKAARTKPSPAVVLGNRNSVKRKRSLSSLSSLNSDNELDWSFRSAQPAAEPHSSPIPETTSSQLLPGSFPHGSRLREFLARPLPVTAPPTSRKLATTLSLSSLGTATQPDIDAIHIGWGLKDHSLAFVRINESGNISDYDEGLWWPAEVRLSVILHGTAMLKSCSGRLWLGSLCGSRCSASTLARRRSLLSASWL